MARQVAAQVEDQGFRQWAREPLHTLGAGIVFSDGASQETTPPRMYTWASEVVGCLLQCYRTEYGQDATPETVEDEVSLMDRDRDRRYRDGRRRYRDSRQEEYQANMLHGNARQADVEQGGTPRSSGGTCFRLGKSLGRWG